MPTSTIELHRVLRAPANRVYRAFIEGTALCKWLPPNGFTCSVDHINAIEGGTFALTFHNFATGEAHSFGGTYLELIANQRIRYTDQFDDPNLSGEILVTISLKELMCGTDIKIVQAGIPEIILPEACYLGWQESLQLLALLVETSVKN
ncbi:SRPBCC family protein [Pseudoalteromonas tunicata]|jgi:uncharacterized protein YndB with AHSA1/START domain|uniref:Activator of Hsp90 ATPase homologue 1/2-like C-terminal domain-containing protein n=1 Tax=Pseudoalteromonas tunicata D2 TaxID=87626 RepID=A4C3K8_9GAMM|nr:SRPBCC family protein [Pseudoalteromonas tunicata]ATC96579.1 hypothetical protein PTUN_b0126 [Pseudoalteromonas tunicata]AXT32765.1 polyketide cyclase [Pseudoalteromonas tunicata]EAR30140.1 hypothetical protein PTD2_01186 [Pseudoalteromonas tunicata D2]